MMEAIYSSETSVLTRATRRDIPEGDTEGLNPKAHDKLQAVHNMPSSYTVPVVALD
jgi:hypothetical protein